MGKITRYGSTAILSEAVEYHGFVFTAGLTADDLSQDITGQTKQVSGQDRRRAGSRRHRQDAAAASADLAQGHPRPRRHEQGVDRTGCRKAGAPARACVQANMADPRHLVEIMVVASPLRAGSGAACPGWWSGRDRCEASARPRCFRPRAVPTRQAPASLPLTRQEVLAGARALRRGGSDSDAPSVASRVATPWHATFLPDFLRDWRPEAASACHRQSDKSRHVTAYVGSHRLVCPARVSLTACATPAQGRGTRQGDEGMTRRAGRSALFVLVLLAGGAACPCRCLHPRPHGRSRPRVPCAPPPSLPGRLPPRPPSGRRPSVASLTCVPYARMVSGIDLRGNARDWWAAAAGRYHRSQVPEVGAVLVFPASGSMRAGHVAVVEQVLGPRHILIHHANWEGPGIRGKAASRAGSRWWMSPPTTIGRACGCRPASPPASTGASIRRTGSSTTARPKASVLTARRSVPTELAEAPAAMSPHLAQHLSSPRNFWRPGADSIHQARGPRARARGRRRGMSAQGWPACWALLARQHNLMRVGRNPA